MGGQAEDEVDPQLRAFLAELYEFGRQNDAAAQTTRAGRMLNITPETGDFLRMLVISGNHGRVCELGTSNGYSTLWLADACRHTGGRVITVESNPTKHTMACENLRRAGLDGWVDPRLMDVADFLPAVRDFDLVFLDTDRSQYVGWWPALQQKLRPGGLLVVDNAASHAGEMAPFVEAVEATPGFTSVLVPIGNGELLVLKEL
jgi:predicted O-methyltransferase YrrM